MALGIANVFNSIVQYVALSSAVGAVFASAPSQLPRVENPIPVCDPTVPRERTRLTAIVDALALGSSASGAIYEYDQGLLVIAKGGRVNFTRREELDLMAFLTPGIDSTYTRDCFR
jgi:hypothetical protein